MEDVEKQINEQMARAFLDNVIAIINKNEYTEEDILYIVSLYEELRERIADLTPNRNDLHKQLNESMDLDIFKNMLKYNALDDESIHNMILFVFQRLLSLEAPYRDVATLKQRDTLISNLGSGVDRGQVIGNFLLSSHVIIDGILYDIEVQSDT